MLGPDPLATVVFGGVALVTTAAFLGAAGIDGSQLGVLDIIVSLTPLLAIAGYLFWVNRGRGEGDAVERVAVSILITQADDPTVRGDDVLSRAAADLVAALTDADREDARSRLLRALSERG